MPMQLHCEAAPAEGGCAIFMGFLPQKQAGSFTPSPCLCREGGSILSQPCG